MLLSLWLCSQVFLCPHFQHLLPLLLHHVSQEVSKVLGDFHQAVRQKCKAYILCVFKTHKKEAYTYFICPLESQSWPNMKWGLGEGWDCLFVFCNVAI